MTSFTNALYIKILFFAEKNMLEAFAVAPQFSAKTFKEINLVTVVRPRVMTFLSYPGS